MGQAKARGSFEERKAEAVKKKAEQDRIRREIAKRRPSPKISKEGMVLNAIISGLCAPYFTKLNR